MINSTPPLGDKQLCEPGAVNSAISRKLALIFVLCAPLVFAAALLGLVRGVEPFASWFYVFGWWSYIIFLDGLVYLRSGRSMLLSRTRAFAYLMPWSCLFWLFFEVINWRLENWYYVGLPAADLSRGLGIFISFATVLPGVFETADLLRSFGLFEGTRVSTKRWAITATRSTWMVRLGWCFMLLPLIFPRYFFPLVWGATTLLLEPRLARRGHPGLWTLLAAGRPARLYQMLLAGVITGFLWESWNYWASAKWIYTVPFFEDSKLFEMPFAGFLGFPPFALECYTFARFLVYAKLSPEYDPALPSVEASASNKSRRQRWTLVATLLCIPLIVGLDRWTVRSTAASEAQLAELTEGQRELTRNALMGLRGLAWLASIDVHDREALAQLEFDELWQRLHAEGSGPAPLPTRAEARVWWNRVRRRSAIQTAQLYSR